MTSRVPALLGWLVLLAIAVLMSSTPRAPGEAEVPDQSAYDASGGLEFTLEAGETWLRLQSWLEIPPQWALDPRATWPYAIEITVRDLDGAVRSVQRHWQSSRVSWSAREALPLRPRIGGPNPLRPITDDRLLSLDLRELAPAGGVLAVHPTDVPEGGRVLVTAIHAAERSALSRLRVAQHADDVGQADLAAGVGPLGFAELPWSWRSELARLHWQRIAPLPTGERVVREAIEVRAGASASFSDAAARGVPVAPGAAVAFNLYGSTTLHAEWIDPFTGERSAAPTLLRLIGVDGSEVVSDVGEVDRLDVDFESEGLVSAQVALDIDVEGPRVLRAWLDAADDDALTFGDPPRVRSTDRVWLAPDLRALEAWRVGPDTSPLLFHHVAGEQLRVVLRLPLPYEPRTPFVPEPPLPLGTLVRLRALADDGSELSRWSTRVDPEPSLFERYAQGDDAGRTQVSEPELFYVDPPEGTAVLQVEASSLVDVTLQVADARGSAADLPLDGYDLGDIAADLRYEAFALRAWAARAPVAVDALAREGRAVRIDAQCRLEPRGAAPEGRQLEVVALALGSAFHLVAEEVEPSTSVEAVRTRLDRKPRRVVVPSSGRLVIEYRMGTPPPGRRLKLEIDGQPREVQVRTATGVLVVDRLEPGARRVAIEHDGIYLAKAPGDATYRVQRAYRLAPDAPLHVDVPALATRLVVSVWRPADAGGARLDWTRRLPGPEGELVASRRPAAGSYDLVPQGVRALPVSFAGPPLSTQEPLVLGLAPEADGAWQVELVLRGTSQPAWVRLEALWPDEVSP